MATRNKAAFELGNAAHRLDRVAQLDEKLCQVFAQEALVFEQDDVCHGVSLRPAAPDWTLSGGPNCADAWRPGQSADLAGSRQPIYPDTAWAEFAVMSVHTTTAEITIRAGRNFSCFQLFARNVPARDTPAGANRLSHGVNRRTT